MRILVAEDSEVNQVLALAMLDSLGHEAVVAADGEAALRALARGTFDAVLMDVQMPVLSGLEATRRFRETEAGSGSRVPIIAMTANAMQGDREACLEAGMDGYLAKPIRRQQLAEALDAAAAKTEFDGLSSALDKAAKRGIIHRNVANRRKSRLNKAVIAAKAAK